MNRGSPLEHEFFAFEQFGDVILFDVDTMDIRRFTGESSEAPGGVLRGEGLHRNGTARGILRELGMDDFRLDLPGSAAGGGGTARRSRDTGKINTLGLNIAEDCNLRCSYCYKDHGPFGMAPGRMSRETAERAIDLLFDLSDETINHIYFFGGEPLLNLTTAVDAVRHARMRYHESGRHPRFYLVTNGTLLSPETARILREMEIQLLVGIDGPAGVHDELRRDPDGGKTYRTVESRISSLADELRFGSVTVLSEHETDLVNLAEHLRSIGCNDMIFKLPMHLVDGADEWIGSSKHDLLPQLSRFALHYLEESLTNGYRRRWNLHKGDILFDRLLLLHRKLKLDYPCDAGIHEIGVSANGDIYPCPYFTGEDEFRIGDVSTGIDDTRLRGFIRAGELAGKNDCGQCWARYLCGGGCLRDVFGTSGRLDRANPLKCGITRHIARLSIYVYARLEEEFGEFLGLHLNPEALEVFQRMGGELPAHREAAGHGYA